LVAVDFGESFLGGIDDELGWIVAKEALSHVDDGLLGRCCGALIYDGPRLNVSSRYRECVGCQQSEASPWRGSYPAMLASLPFISLSPREMK
jgi:hypothetical protein